jgi:hypothetical protein
MFKKEKKKNIIPDIKEFVDDAGKKWVQTSTDDLFTLGGLNDVLEAIEKEKQSGEIVFARIDFQKVNREYYDAAVELQKKLIRQNELLKKLTSDSKTIIERKNKKLKELIDYIKKIHTFLEYLSLKDETIENIELPKEFFAAKSADESKLESVYEEAVEILLSPEGVETTPIKN